MKLTRFLSVAFVLVLASAFSVSVFTAPHGQAPTPQATVSLHLTLGNPSGATTSTTNKDNFLLVKPQFALSYNNRKGGPNWVSWHLEADDVGSAKRRNRFRPDDQLPAGFKRIVTGIYTNTGYARGHQCNSEDRTETQEDNDATFAMTNILPQLEANNGGPWKGLEEFSRKQLAEGKELYIVAGGFGTKGSFGEANRKVNIPRVFWKVAVVLPVGNNDLRRVSTSTRTIAVCMPNEERVRGTKWQEYVGTIRNVEAATGYNFLSEVSRSVQNAIETRKDSEGTNSGNPCR